MNAIKNGIVDMMAAGLMFAASDDAVGRQKAAMTLISTGFTTLNNLNGAGVAPIPSTDPVAGPGHVRHADTTLQIAVPAIRDMVIQFRTAIRALKDGDAMTARDRNVIRRSIRAVKELLPEGSLSDDDFEAGHDA